MINVLVVEDVAEMREEVVAALAQRPRRYRALEAGTAVQAIKAAVVRPDVAILDLALPERSASDPPSWKHGRRVMRWLRERWPRLPVVSLSAEHDRVRDMLLAEGANDFLYKGDDRLFAPGQLLGTLERLLGCWPTASESCAALLHALDDVRQGAQCVLLNVARANHAHPLREIVAGRLSNWSADLTEIHPTALAQAPDCVAADAEGKVLWVAGPVAEWQGPGVQAALEGWVARRPAAPSRLVCVVEGDGGSWDGPAPIMRLRRRELTTLRVPSPLEDPADVCDLLEALVRVAMVQAGGHAAGLSAPARQALIRACREQSWPEDIADLEREAEQVAGRLDAELILPQHLSPHLRAADEGQRPASVVSCDVVDSTRLKASATSEQAQQTFDRYLALTRAVMEQRGGEIVSVTGDGHLTVFAHARDAVEAAIALRAAIQEFNVKDNATSFPLVLRIGVASGALPATLEQFGAIVAPVLDLASKLQQTARPDEVLICEATYCCLDTSQDEFIALRHPVCGVRAYSA